MVENIWSSISVRMSAEYPLSATHMMMLVAHHHPVQHENRGFYGLPKEPQEDETQIASGQ